MSFLESLFIYNEKNPMIFTNPQFWFFFLFILIIYQGIYKNNAGRNAFLLIFSFFFYYKSGGYFFTLLIVSTVMDYSLANMIYRSQSESRKKWWIVLSLVVNLGLLAYFKYAYFFTDLFNQVSGSNVRVIDYLALWTNQVFGSRLDISKIILPVGISFYTFQSISYIIDVYRGHMAPVKNIWDYAFFVSFFPQLVAGPIVRAVDFAPQMYENYRLEHKEYSRALYLIVNGLVKKMLISDYISTNFVDRVFESPERYSGFENLMAVYGYAIQIYCDFSGYTDIAIGLALLLGFRLNLNFNSPYVATSITDFWRRWHISLSTWLRDYLYISLGGNRKGRFRTYLNLMITMLLGGLWHGAHIKFIIWGGLHGAALALHKFWMDLGGNKKKEPVGLRRFLGQLITFHFVCFCWIYFRANDLQTVNKMLFQIGFSFHWAVIPQILAAYAEIFVIMLAGFAIHWIPRSLKDEVVEFFTAIPDYGKAFLIALVALILYQVRTSDIQPFIYFQF